MQIPSATCFFHAPTGTKIHFTQTGNPNGPLIVLLHGLGGSTQTFQSLLPFLSPEINRLISVDLEGFGQTTLSSPDTTLSIPRYVDNLEYLVATLQKPDGSPPRGKITIIGHSLGAIIAMHYACKHPNQIRGLALLGPGRSIAHIPAARERMLGLAVTTRKEGIQAAADTAAISNFPLMGGVAPETRQVVREAVASCEPEVYAKTCEAIAGLDHLDPQYSSIAAPTLLLAGGGDVISPPERSIALAELIGDNAWVQILDGVGHQMILQDLNGSVEAIRGLLKKSES
ncbi:uncharacterized protein N7459_002944 [Penicillium hispanicum]|uniref:uncharacterized protein n=1 Tax=Penicillium hispanicum TaxID=1080232 RepID=UPI0025404320|nr:uncharacterized protein N7459_002944 [Penicillium hispanicum]KAJ5587179.1 hypothetical protein N7459_002944 [Penicillium hispanicum]